MTIPQAFDLALQHHQAGRLVEAETLYRQVLATQPGHADALHLLGVIAHQKGHYEVATELIRRSITLEPHNAAAHSNLGETYRLMGRLEEALASHRQALQCTPLNPSIYYNLGNVFREQHSFDDALAAFRRALELKPDFAEAHTNLGNTLNRLGRLEEAIASYLSALKIKPDYPEAYNNLGNAYDQQDKLDEALGAFHRALRLKPDSSVAYYNMGLALATRERFDEATAAFRRALELDPDNLEARNNLGNTLLDQGQSEEAIACFRRAMELAPTHPGIHSNLIYALHLVSGVGQTIIADEQRRWSRKFVAPGSGNLRGHPNNRDPERRLRIGYVSPDFRGHAVGRNLLPLFRCHDHRNFEILCYSGVIRPDELTGEFQKRVDHWRSMVGVPDEKLEETIRNDGVDILVDLTQHTAGDRLPVFARQPAPVQVSFAGYPDTTGVETIRYRISDRYLELVPMASEECERGPRTEQVFLIDSFWCYDPYEIGVESNELPARHHEGVTFGSLANFRKINEPLLKLWARVLAKHDASRLVVLTAAGSHRLRVLEILGREGIEGRRVEFAERCSHQDYLELYRRLDIMLDTFPYNGHTTSLDALWMGVPVISLAGETRVSRGGLSILNNLGLPELVAQAEDEYVEIATRLAGDLPRLAELRRTLRSRMETSLLMDAPRFAHNIEAAYRAMWRHWCTETPVCY